jgi:hypothetical protein
MTFIEVYNRIIPHWGDIIDFSDGVISKSENIVDTPGTTPNEEGYFHSDSFRRQWDKIEETVGHDDTYGDLMVWTMYQLFHRHARQLFQDKVFYLNPREIEKEKIEEQYFINLNGESWEEELKNYKRLID